MPNGLWGTLWGYSRKALLILPKLLIPKGYLVSAAGLEPATHALKGHCSTN